MDDKEELRKKLLDLMTEAEKIYSKIVEDCDPKYPRKIMILCNDENTNFVLFSQGTAQEAAAVRIFLNAPIKIFLKEK